MAQWIEIQHFGSTAIPGIPAKPVIDMLGGVPSMELADFLLPRLSALGWETSAEFNATLADRRFLRKRDASEVRTHHLHIVVHGGPQWIRCLAFRDFLRSNPWAIEEYAVLKATLAKRFKSDREAYTDAKKEFVERILQLASA